MRSSIGSARNAARVMEYHNGYEPWEIPPDFSDISYLSSGCTRDAYLIGNVVYKVHNGGGMNENETEYKRTKELELPAPFRIPTTNLFWVDDEPVIAMRYIHGSPVDPFTFPSYSEWSDRSDSCMENYLVSADGFVYVIDLGF